MDIEKKKEIIGLIENWELGFIRADEMIEKICELDEAARPTILKTLNRIKASDEYLQILAESERKINALLLRDNGIFALINYHKLIALNC